VTADAPSPDVETVLARVLESHGVAYSFHIAREQAAALRGAGLPEPSGWVQVLPCNASDLHTDAHVWDFGSGEDFVCYGTRGATALDLTRLNHGVCPRCREDKFIGHGPLCPDCFGASS
jgi:hypothetical protein